MKIKVLLMLWLLAICGPAPAQTPSPAAPITKEFVEREVLALLLDDSDTEARGRRALYLNEQSEALISIAREILKEQKSDELVRWALGYLNSHASDPAEALDLARRVAIEYDREKFQLSIHVALGILGNLGDRQDYPIIDMYMADTRGSVFPAAYDAKKAIAARMGDPPPPPYSSLRPRRGPPVEDWYIPAIHGSREEWEQRRLERKERVAAQDAAKAAEAAKATQAARAARQARWTRIAIGAGAGLLLLGVAAYLWRRRQARVR